MPDLNLLFALILVSLIVIALAFSARWYAERNSTPKYRPQGSSASPGVQQALSQLADEVNGLRRETQRIADLLQTALDAQHSGRPSVDPGGARSSTQQSSTSIFRNDFDRRPLPSGGPVTSNAPTSVAAPVEFSTRSPNEQAGVAREMFLRILTGQPLPPEWIRENIGEDILEGDAVRKTRWRGLVVPGALGDLILVRHVASSDGWVFPDPSKTSISDPVRVLFPGVSDSDLSERRLAQTLDGGRLARRLSDGLWVVDLLQPN